MSSSSLASRKLAVTLGARFSRVVKGPIGLAGQGHRIRIDDPVIVGAHVVMRMSGDMAFKVPQLVHDAALDRDAWPIGSPGRPATLGCHRSHRAGPSKAPGDQVLQQPLSFLRSIRPGENAI